MNSEGLRTIRFRGKPEVAKAPEWVYGNFIAPQTIRHLNSDVGREWLVTPETIGQFTGLTDANGKEIYEGDILLTDSYERGIVQYLDAQFCVGLTPLADFYIGTAHGNGQTDLQVIGNIHDNPELIK